MEKGWLSLGIIQPQPGIIQLIPLTVPKSLMGVTTTAASPDPRRPSVPPLCSHMVRLEPPVPLLPSPGPSSVAGT